MVMTKHVENKFNNFKWKQKRKNGNEVQEEEELVVEVVETAKEYPTASYECQLLTAAPAAITDINDCDVCVIWDLSLVNDYSEFYGGAHVSSNQMAHINVCVCWNWRT